MVMVVVMIITLACSVFNVVQKCAFYDKCKSISELFEQIFAYNSVPFCVKLFRYKRQQVLRKIQCT